MAESHDKRSIAALTCDWEREFDAFVALRDEVEQIARSLPKTHRVARALEAALRKYKPSEPEETSNV